jgi:CubicO group peptidase (beta-lactamase class C family)
MLKLHGIARTVVAVGLATIVTVGGGCAAVQSGAVKTIDDYLMRLQGFGFSGAVLVAQNGRVLFRNAYGAADRDRAVPFRTNTIFDVGSVTKQFTASAILLLEAEDKLAVTDSIGKFFDHVPPDKAGITIHQLLTHTSGLPLDFGGDYDPVSRQQLVDTALRTPLARPPGTRHAYSNAGYALLAAIVELVSGQSFEAFLTARMFRPAGMRSTGYFLPAGMHSRMAVGYKGDTAWGIGTDRAAKTGGDFWNLIGNGGVHSTVEDLNRWMVALERGHILPGPALNKLWEPKVLVRTNYADTGAALYYAYGWYVLKSPAGKTMVWHLGGNGVFNCAIRWHVEDRTLVVYGSSVAEFHDPAYPVPAVERMIAGAEVALPPKVLVLDRAELAPHTGRYRAPSGEELQITAAQGWLRVEGEGQAAFAFATGGTWSNNPTLDSLTTRTRETIENSRFGRYDAMVPNYAPGATAESIGSMEREFWRKRHERHGEYVRTRVLGTLPSLTRLFPARSYVTVDFTRGSTYREYIWGESRTIVDLGPIVAPPSARFFAEPGGCFAAFDPAEATARRLCFDPGGSELLTVSDRLGNRVALAKVP